MYFDQDESQLHKFLIKISIDKRTCILYITVYCMQNSEKGNEL